MLQMFINDFRSVPKWILRKFSATTYHSRPRACQNSERPNFTQKILGRVILDQKMAVESKKTGFRGISRAQMCQNLPFIPEKHQKSPNFPVEFKNLTRFFSTLKCM